MSQTTTTIIGRQAEHDQLKDLLTRARAGSSAVTVLRGEAGIGKTALLDALDQSASDFTIIRARGLSSEAELSFAVLGDVARPLASTMIDLPARERAVLEGALGLGDPVTTEAFGVAAAMLQLISAAAVNAPLLIRIDDCQWVDESSLACLAFVAKRLAADRVVIIFSERSWPGPSARTGALAGLEVIELHRMSEDDATQLIKDHAGALSVFDRRQVLARAHGHPLTLVELSRSLQGSGQDQAIPSWDLEAACLAEVDRLPAATRTAVQLLAALDESDSGWFGELIASVGGSIADLDPARASGLVELVDERLRFRHPLIGTAVYGSLPPSHRRDLHRAIAGAYAASEDFADLERQVWHRVAATTVADDALADDLEAVAAAALSRSSAATAVQLLQRSAQFSVDPVRKVTRLLGAADHVQSAGMVDRADELLGEAARLAPDPEFAMRVEHMRCRFDMWRGQPTQARDRLVRLAMAAAATAPVPAAVMYGHAGLTSLWLGDLAAAADVLDRAEQLVAGSGASVLAVTAPAALLDLITGHQDRGRQRLEVCTAGLGEVSPLSTEQLPLIVALGRFATEDVEGGLMILEQTVLAAREHAAIGLLPFLLTRTASVQLAAGRWHAAFASASEAIEVATDTGWITEIPAAVAILATVEAARGNEAACRAMIAQALAVGREAGAIMIIIQAQLALGLLELGLGRPAEAAAAYEQVAAHARDRGLVENPLTSWLPDLGECYLRTGDRASANGVIEELTALTGANGRPRLLAALDRLRGLATTESEEAAEFFARSAERAEAAGDRFGSARSLLALGQLRRRQRQRSAARGPLSAALGAFEHLGARTWAEQTRSELVATGVTLPDPPRRLADLSAQEMSAVQAAADGLTNQETAQRLFISVRTVEFHLSNAYRKLGISRRGQLAGVLAS